MIVVVDVVESVRLIAEHESDVIDRWRRLVGEVRTAVLPSHGGRLVKSLGDGMLLEFESVPPAIRAALEVQHRLAPYNAHLPAERMMHLRIGVHAADVVVDELDVYGAGVNLAARLTTLAGPGDIVVSDDVRDELVDGLDGDVEDMGECFLKHIERPVRAWRLRTAVPSSPPRPTGADQFRAAIAVLPLAMRGPLADGVALGEIVADDLTNALCKQPHCKVVSRLSTSAIAGRGLGTVETGTMLGVRYLVSGSLLRRDAGYRIVLELADAVRDEIVWNSQADVGAAELMQDQGRFAQESAQAILGALIGAELRRFAALPLPNLHGYSALIGCIGAMHRMSRHHSGLAKAGLEHLVDRYPRAADPLAWLGKWHLLQNAQGWSADPERDVARADDLISRALDLSPDHALALTLDGQVAASARGDEALALTRMETAIAQNPNEPLAWLYLSNVLANAGRSGEAVQASTRAIELSPIDPTRFLYEIFAAYAELVAGRHDRALEHARGSIRANCQHLPSYPILIVSEVLCGHAEQAREQAAVFLRMHPGMSVARYAARHRGRPEVVELCARAMRQAGLPA